MDILTPEAVRNKMNAGSRASRPQDPRNHNLAHYGKREADLKIVFSFLLCYER
jgi:hypothetical protein